MDILIKLANKRIRKGANPQKTLCLLPIKEGYIKTYRPYGEQGAGFYYMSIIKEEAKCIQ